MTAAICVDGLLILGHLTSRVGSRKVRRGADPGGSERVDGLLIEVAR